MKIVPMDADYSSLPGYLIGDNRTSKLNGQKEFGDKLIKIVEKELASKKLFSLIQDQRHGSGLANIAAAVEGSALKAGIDDVALDKLLRDTISDKGFLQSYNYFMHHDRLNLGAPEAFALAYVANETNNLTQRFPHWPDEETTFLEMAYALAKPMHLDLITDAMAYMVRSAGIKVDMVAVPDARGFLYADIARKLGAGIYEIRKEGKMPLDDKRRLASATYKVEYKDIDDGKRTIQGRADIDIKGLKILGVDDVLATAGTRSGINQIISDLGGIVSGHLSVYDLTFLEQCPANIRADGKQLDYDVPTLALVVLK